MILKTDQSEIQNYLSDASNYAGNCEGVYFPETKEEVSEIINDANRSNNKITIAGNRTGLTGGSVPENGILISTEKLNKIIEINKDEKYAVVQSGVLLREFIETVDSMNLYYTPDPTEKDCYIGGNVANNASGAKTFKYGPTRNYVLALDVILPNGDEIHFERGKVFADGYKLKLETKNGNILNIDLPGYEMPLTKHAAGYFVKKDMDAIDLFIGSEGTLGFITEVKLKLLDKPQNILSSVIFFDNEEDGLNFIDEARSVTYETRENGKSNELDALGLEYFDDNSLKFLKEEYPKIPTNANAAVWFEQEFTSENEEEIFNKWIELIEKCNGDIGSAWFANNEKDRKEFGEFRHAIAWKVNEYMARKNIMKVGTDIAVPVENFREFYWFAKNKVAEKNIHQVAYGHFGDCHVHLNMLPENKDEYKTAKDIYMELCKKGVELNGTISAEHGIGKLKRQYLFEMFGENKIREMAKLKRQFDPKLILNFGNIIEPKYFNEIQ